MFTYTYTAYIAKDGTKFREEKECAIYETANKDTWKILEEHGLLEILSTVSFLDFFHKPVNMDFDSWKDFWDVCEYIVISYSAIEEDLKKIGSLLELMEFDSIFPQKFNLESGHCYALREIDDFEQNIQFWEDITEKQDKISLELTLCKNALNK